MSRFLCDAQVLLVEVQVLVSMDDHSPHITRAALPSLRMCTAMQWMLAAPMKYGIYPSLCFVWSTSAFVCARKPLRQNLVRCLRLCTNTTFARKHILNSTRVERGTQFYRPYLSESEMTKTINAVRRPMLWGSLSEEGHRTTRVHYLVEKLGRAGFLVRVFSATFTLLQTMLRIVEYRGSYASTGAHCACQGRQTTL